MAIRVFVNGANGKMGQLACQAIEQSDECTLAGKGIRGDDLMATLERTNAEVVLDLTSAHCVYENTATIIATGKHPVIGTSGLLPEEVQALQEICKTAQLGGIIAPNFSISSLLMTHFAGIAATFLPRTEIIEYHHEGKHDAPSGTAIKAAHAISTAKQPSPLAPSNEILPGARGANVDDIPVHSLRLPGVLAKQQIIFSDKGETLMLEHNCIDRACFMPGLLLACREAVKLNTLVYGLESFLGTCTK